jgi:hypothetical protein
VLVSNPAPSNVETRLAACSRRPAVMDYAPCHRKMERAAIVGDRPYGIGETPVARAAAKRPAVTA